LKGRYGEAIVYADRIEEGALSQIKNLVDHPISKDANVRIMPDVHAGVGCVIGFTAKLGRIVVPNLIGVDIGCGVLAFKFRGMKLKESDFRRIDAIIKQNIPSGTRIRDVFSPYAMRVAEDYLKLDFSSFQKSLGKLCDKTKQDRVYVLNSIGTLGGGNHFIEINASSDGVYFVVHTGSRNFGLNVANYHQKKAKKLCRAPVPPGMEYLDGKDAQEYMEDMKIAQTYARLNRYTIMITLKELFTETVESEVIESVHNYINFDDGIIRKGAISAHRNERLLIPFNMAYGTLIGIGKGNRDWNFSAPHGAGRRISRKRARKELSVKEFRKAMGGIYSTCVGKKTIDESPMAYKDAEEVLKYLDETVEVVEIVKPVYNFKAA